MLPSEREKREGKSREGGALLIAPQVTTIAAKKKKGGNASGRRKDYIFSLKEGGKEIKKSGNWRKNISIRMQSLVQVGGARN